MENGDLKSPNFFDCPGIVTRTGRSPYATNWCNEALLAIIPCLVQYTHPGTISLVQIMRDVLRAGTGTCPYKNLMNRSV